MGRRTTTIMFGCDMPEEINHRGDEENAPDGGPSLTLEDFESDEIQTYSTGDRYMIGYPIVGDIEDMPTMALDEIERVYKAEIEQARGQWTRFAAWAKAGGVELGEAKVYLTPSER